MSGDRIDLRRGLSHNPMNATNLFHSTGWVAGFDNAVLEKAIEHLELRMCMGDPAFTPLERFAAQVLVKQYEYMVGKICKDKS
ncbi:hypothetical protein [Methylobacterium indicum]|uniref:Uncharacterized protein n=1 Tax=Methylobacterium indicum TaxID=1775910 RepID=A0A8H9CA13_9HYPH|nr:hypothetical protein [Methylobacterium indicum]BCM87828.1 hypothetical protein mvi_62890 [Methylobacterium indicum]